MAINTVAIQETIDALKQRITKDTQLVSSLEELIGQLVDAPAPAKRGSARQAKVEPPKVRKTRTAKADPPDGQERAKTHNLTCAKCSSKYIGARKNAACPYCNPRIVTAKEAYA